jgi:hypothetical protein
MAHWLKELLGFFHRLRRIVQKTVGWPLIGEIGDRFLVAPPRLPTGAFGEAVQLPTVLEIYVSGSHQWPLDIGEKVDAIFFPADPPIVFNVCFSCAKPSLLKGGDYANPESHWFNVFFGFYEIDVRCSEWSRPFGFTSPTASALEFADLLRIGKSDWNYFSNYVYGVPGEECAKYDAIPAGLPTRVVNPNVRIGGHDYVEAEVDGLEVVSGYVSGRDGKRLRNNNGFFSPIWRIVFGRPKRKAAFPVSLVPTRMRMRFYIRHERGYDADLECDAYKTFIYGGTINLGYAGPLSNAAFLDAQMEAVRNAIAAQPFRKHHAPTERAKWKP